MKYLSDKGFTLVEMILSIALLGIICVAVLSAMTSHYTMMIRARYMTQNLFQAQQEMEVALDQVRTEFIENTIDDTFVETLNLWGRTVRYMPHEVQIATDKGRVAIYAVTSDTKLAPIQMPSIGHLAIQFGHNASAQYAKYNLPNLRINSSFFLNDPENVFLTQTYRWYVSKPGYYIPTIIDPEEVEIRHIYPLFPDDYQLILNASGKNLTEKFSNYVGRHVVQTVTPAAVTGRLGETAVSNPLFLTGLPISIEPLIHLDASLISRDASEQVRKHEEVEYVKVWHDLTTNPYNAVQNNEARQPRLKQEVIASDYDKTSFQYVQLNENTSREEGLTIQMTNGISTSDVTGFIVFKTNYLHEDRNGRSIMRFYRRAGSSNTNIWHLGWDDEGHLVFEIVSTGSEGGLKSVILEHNTAIENGEPEDEMEGNLDYSIHEDQWYILEWERSDKDFSFRINAYEIIEESIQGNIGNNANRMTLGHYNNSDYTDISIGELVFFNQLLDDEKKALVRMYLNEKYKLYE